MNDFEDALGREWMEVKVPAGFADRVMERLAWREAKRRREMLPWRLAIAAGILLAVSAGGLGAGFEVHERHLAENARQQFAVAMQVTNRSLVAVDRSVDRSLGRDLSRMDKPKGETR